MFSEHFVPPSRLKAKGNQVFSVAVHKLWNTLLNFIRSSPSVETFEINLKTPVLSGLSVSFKLL